MPVDHGATRAGRKFQRDLMKYLREKGLDAENLVLTGTEDEGDVLLRMERRYVLEAKRERGVNLAGWVTEAQTEAENYAKHRDLPRPGVRFAVVAARRNASIGKAYVITTLDEWLEQIA